MREHACLRFAAQLAGTVRPARAHGADDRLPRLPRRAPRAIRWRPTAIRRWRSREAARVRFEASAWRPAIEEALTPDGARSRERARHPLGFAGARRPRPAAAAPGSTSAGAARPSRAAGRRRAPIGDGARTEHELARLRALGTARRLSAPAAPAVARPITRSPCRCAIRSSGRSPTLVVRHGHRFEIRREGESGERCAALKVAAPGATPRYACTIYDNRPQAVPRVRGERAALPRRAPAGRAVGGRGVESAAMAETSICSCRSTDVDAPLAPQVARALGWSARTASASCASSRRSLDARKGRPLGQRLRVAGRASRRGAGARRCPRVRARRWPAGRPAAARGGGRLRAGRAPGRRCGSPRRASPRPSSSRASRCSRAAAIWRSSRAASSRRARTTASARAARAPTPTASSTRAPRIAPASPR